MTREPLEVILAGGQGSRLGDLTGDIPKPFVPFGGDNRIMDFVLSNAFNSGSKRILVLTQYQAEHLERYIDNEWKNLLKDAGTEIRSLRSKSGHPYTNTADAVYQNRKQIESLSPSLVGVLCADHIYSMDYSQMYRAHLQQDADVTITAMPVPLSDARKRFGVLEVDLYGKVVGFEEKPQEPKPIPSIPEMCWTNLGIYAFKPKILVKILEEDAQSPSSSHDFGKDIIPKMIEMGMKAIVYDFKLNKVEGVPVPYWADVGIPDDYYRTHMDIVGKNPRFNIRNPSWPLHIVGRQTRQPLISEYAKVIDSIISPGAKIGESRIANSVVFPNVQIEDYAEITDSVVLPNARIGKSARIANAIVNKSAHISDGLKIGMFETLNQKLDLRKTPGGIYVVGKNLSGYKA